MDVNSDPWVSKRVLRRNIVAFMQSTSALWIKFLKASASLCGLWLLAVWERIMESLSEQVSKQIENDIVRLCSTHRHEVDLECMLLWVEYINIDVIWLSLLIKHFTVWTDCLHTQGQYLWRYGFLREMNLWIGEEIWWNLALKGLVQVVIGVRTQLAHTIQERDLDTWTSKPDIDRGSACVNAPIPHAKAILIESGIVVNSRGYAGWLLAVLEGGEVGLDKLLRLLQPSSSLFP